MDSSKTSRTYQSISKYIKIYQNISEYAHFCAYLLQCSWYADWGIIQSCHAADWQVFMVPLPRTGAPPDADWGIIPDNYEYLNLPEHLRIYQIISVYIRIYQIT